MEVEGRSLEDKRLEIDVKSELKVLALGHELATRLRLFREKAGLNQQYMSSLLSTTQSRISQMEDPDYGKYNLQSLVKYAVALGFDLKIEFVKDGAAASDAEIDSMGDFGVHMWLREAITENYHLKTPSYESMTDDSPGTEQSAHRSDGTTAA